MSNRQSDEEDEETTGEKCEESGERSPKDEQAAAAWHEATNYTLE